MADVTLTSSIRSNLLSLQNTSKLLDLTSNRLSTGKKVNSALDNPGSFFTARGLSNRAADLTKLKDGIGQAIQTLKTADQGLTSITNLVEQAKSIAEQAKEAYASVPTVDTTQAVTAAALGSYSLVSAGLATTAKSVTFTITGGSAVTLTAGTTLDSAATLLSGLTGVTATFDDAADTFVLALDQGVEVTADKQTANTKTFLTATSAGSVLGSTTTPTSVATLEADYNKVLGQITELVGNGDTAYKGINLLKSTDLTVSLSENASELTINGVDATLAGLGLSTAAWGSESSVTENITEVSGSVDTLRNFSSSFGTDLSILQYRQDYTSQLVNTLEDGSGLLVNASLEEEAANMLALQTRQSLGTQSLSISNQSQQSILSLFR